MFTHTVKDFCTQLDKRPAFRATQKLKKPKKATKHFVPLSKVKMPETAQVKLPTLVSPADVKLSLKELASFHKDAMQYVKKLSPQDRRKLSALAAAGKSGGSVRETFKAMRDGNTSAALAKAKDIQRGLELAKKEKLDLDASW